MDLKPYVDTLNHELMVAAEAGGDDARALAERLVAPLDSATRLTLLRALSAAAEEITLDLAPGSVELRLRGLEPSFVVTPSAPEPSFEDNVEPSARDWSYGAQPPTPTAVLSGASNDDEGGTARINFRPSEYLKAKIEEAASRDGLSVNAWLIRATTATLAYDGPPAERRAPRGGQRHTGWVG